MATDMGAGGSDGWVGGGKEAVRGIHFHTG